MKIRFSPDWRALWQKEYRHLGWVSVLCFLAGILLCFEGVTPSVPIICGCATFLLGIGIFGWKKWFISRYLILFGFFFALGFGVATIRVKTIAAPVLERPLYDVIISGVIDDASLLIGKQQITISDVRLLNEASMIAPLRIKLRYTSDTPALTIGSRIVVRAFLRPPGKQIVPNGYHEGRVLWFQKIGAVGTIDEVLSLQKTETISPLKRWIEHIRTTISDRIQDVLPDEVARVTIPLIIGEQGVVTPRLYDIFRRSGITHILSVSGFHLSLLAAFIFLLIRGILSLFPTIVERVSPQKIAAIMALIFSVGYIGISGLQIPAIRSLIMIAIVLIAVLFDRNALSVRSVTVAAILILVFRPEMILNIGFQLSFLAVLILVTLYQPIYNFIFVRKRMSLFRKALAFIGGFIIIDILVNLATTPFIIYHFQTYALYSGIGNLLTGTLLSFWVMPLLLFAVLLIPFGIDSFLFKMAGWGISYVITVCESISDWPFTITRCPSFPSIALLIMGLGIITLCVMRTHLRLIGFAIIGLGIGLAIVAPRPDVFIGDGGQTIAIRQDDGRLFFLRKGESDFTARLWLSHNGEDTSPRLASEMPDFIWIKKKKIAFTDKSCLEADVCFLPNISKNKADHVLPLYQWETRVVYIRPDDISVQTLGPKKGKYWYMH